MKHLLRCNFFTHWSSFGWTCDIICCLWLYIPSVQLSWSTCYIVISLRCNFFTHSVTKKRKSSFGISENVVWPSMRQDMSMIQGHSPCCSPDWRIRAPESPVWAHWYWPGHYANFKQIQISVHRSGQIHSLAHPGPTRWATTQFVWLWNQQFCALHGSLQPSIKTMLSVAHPAILIPFHTGPGTSDIRTFSLRS